ncbi:MAG: hypothetical protein ACO3TG_03870 [Minisyncoccia bacterium]
MRKEHYTAYSFDKNKCINFVQSDEYNNIIENFIQKEKLLQREVQVVFYKKNKATRIVSNY